MPKLTKIFFDKEFTGLHQNTKLMSFGAVSDCGKTFYAEIEESHWKDGFINEDDEEWIYRNVVPFLNLNERMESGDLELRNDTKHTIVFGTVAHVRYWLESWFKRFNKVEMWSDCLAYDWVLFNQIFGHAFNIPKNVYYIPFDICTSFKERGIDPDINREEFSGMTEGAEKHNALWDAKVIKACYERMNKDA